MKHPPRRYEFVLAGSGWLALTPPRGLTTHRPGWGLGLGAASALGLGFYVTSRLSVNAYSGPVVWGCYSPRK